MAFSSIELLGYASSVMVALSLMMKDIIWLRVFNLIGCILFTTYGFFIDAMPVVVTNSFIACVNVYYLAKVAKGRARGQRVTSK